MDITEYITEVTGELFLKGCHCQSCCVTYTISVGVHNIMRVHYLQKCYEMLIKV